MGYRPDATVLGVLGALLLLNLFAFGFGWIFTSIALMVRTPGTVMTLSWMFQMPVTFASNIYVDPRTMPGWLHAFVAVNPVSLIVTALRGVLDGAPALTDIALAMMAPLLIAAIFAPLTMRLYARER
jgi:ABC-2 type transport system permease protein